MEFFAREIRLRNALASSGTSTTCPHEPPTLNMLTQNAMAAADLRWCPCSANNFVLKGLTALVDTAISKQQPWSIRELKITRVLKKKNMHDHRKPGQ